MMKLLPYAVNMGGQTFASSAVNVSRKFGKKWSYYYHCELTPTYLAEQFFNQVLHMLS